MMDGGTLMNFALVQLIDLTEGRYETLAGHLLTVLFMERLLAGRVRGIMLPRGLSTRATPALSDRPARCLGMRIRLS